MSDKVVKIPTKSKVSFAVYVPGERNPTWIEAADFRVEGDHVLYLSTGSTTVAVFHHWDYVERFEERESAA